MDSIKTSGQDDFNDSRHPGPTITLIKVGIPISSSIPIPTTGNPTAVTGTSLAIDTSCFFRPIIRIDFTGNIIIPVTLPNVTLTFQVFRRYKNQKQLIAVGPAWVFARPLPFTFESNESNEANESSETSETNNSDKFITLSTKDIISFFISDPNFDRSHSGATYTVAVTPNSNKFCGTVTINNATLSAIVSGQRQ